MPTKILFVEDDRVSRAALQGLLEGHGFEVECVGRLAEAVSRLKTGGFKLMLLDGLLPDGTGLQLLSDLRQRGSSIPVLFLSSFFKDRESQKRLAALQAVPLRKPANAAELLTAVDTLLGRVPQRPARAPVQVAAHG